MIPNRRQRILAAGIERAFLLLGLVLFVQTVQAAPANWPRWRGPNADGVSAETNWTTQWSKEGPTQLWRASLGTGLSSVAIDGGLLYTMGNSGTADTVFCFSAANGKPVWKQSYAAPIDPNSFEGGPTSTPAVDGSFVYTVSRSGLLYCFDAATGKIAWFKNIQKELEATAPDWGFGASPLVEGNLVILNAGTHGTAWDKTTGKLVWTSGREKASYATPVPFSVGHQRCVAIFTTLGLVAVNASTGGELWRHPWSTGSDVNAADPIIAGNQFFISSGYGAGAALLEIRKGRPVEVWKNENMQNHFNCSVLLDGCIYGISGQAGEDNELRCVELKTGGIKWAEKLGGYGTLMAADGKLIVFHERGELIVVTATPAGYKALARAQVMGGKCWTPPVLCGGRIYCRNAQGTLVAVDVSGK